MGHKYLELLDYLNKALNEYEVTRKELNEHGFKNDLIDNCIEDNFIREKKEYISLKFKGFEILENYQKQIIGKKRTREISNRKNDLKSERAIQYIDMLLKKINEISKKEYIQNTTQKEFAEIVIDIIRFVGNNIKRIKERYWYPQYSEFISWPKDGVSIYSEFWDKSKPVTIGIAYEDHINDLRTILNDCKKDFELVKIMQQEQISPSIFLSHSWEDKFFTKKLGEKLNENGVKVWIDEAEIKVGDSLIEKISEAIEKNDYVGAVLSHNSVTSPWVQKELHLAMTQEIHGKKVKILPILLEKCDVPPFLKDKMYADFTNADNPEKFNKELLKLLVAIGSKKKSVEIPKQKKFVVTDSRQITIKVTKPENALEKFEDIKIVDIDKSKLYRPDPSKSLYHVPFVLSRAPPGEWSKIFDSERRFPRHTWWRQAWIDGQHIIVHCTLDEVKKVHLNDIKQDVKNTNMKYREYLLNEATEQKRKMQRETEEQKKIDEELDGLDIN